MSKLAGKPPPAGPRSAKVKFPALGVRARGGEVTKNEWGGKRLGALVGARAEVVDGTRVHNVAAATLTLMPLLALTKRTKGACAFIVFGDGTIHKHPLADQKAVAAAKMDAARFNVLAASAS